MTQLFILRKETYPIAPVSLTPLALLIHERKDVPFKMNNSRKFAPFTPRNFREYVEPKALFEG